MKKVFGVNLGKRISQMSVLEFDERDFSREDSQLRFRVVENKDFLTALYFDYNSFSNSFEVKADQHLCGLDLRMELLVRRVVWLYFLQFGPKEQMEEELNTQKLCFEATQIWRTVDRAGSTGKGAGKGFNESGERKDSVGQNVSTVV